MPVQFFADDVGGVGRAHDRGADVSDRLLHFQVVAPRLQSLRLVIHGHRPKRRHAARAELPTSDRHNGTTHRR